MNIDPNSCLAARFQLALRHRFAMVAQQVGRLAHMTDQDYTVSKFDRQFAGLQGGNNLLAKPTTVEHVPLTGEAETFIIQTIRDEKGDNIVIKFVDREGVKRLILPPKVAATISRQKDALTARARSIASRAAMKERMDRGELPGFMKKKLSTADLS